MVVNILVKKIPNNRLTKWGKESGGLSERNLVEKEDIYQIKYGNHYLQLKKKSKSVN